MGTQKKLVSDAFLKDLLDKIDIVSVINSRLGGQLQKKGADYKCKCPFHEEDTPSFVVSEKRQIFTCFGGCFDGKASNAINFIRAFHQVPFPEAVEILCEEAGIEPPFNNEEHLDADAQKKQDIFAALADAAELYQGFLANDSYKTEAVKYLKGRGITGQLAKKFGLGYAPSEWAIVMKHLSKRHGAQTLKDAGLLVEKNGKKYDLFRDRIMFPISDRRGRIIGFGGRRVDDSSDAPKYINSPETMVFRKSFELYNFDKAQNAARKSGKLYIVEGYTDVTTHAQFGIEDTVAPLGTAFTQGQLEKVLSVTSEPVMCFDGDKAGRDAAWKCMMMSLPHLNDGVRMKFLFYPEGYDPDTLLRKEGSDAYLARLSQAMPLSQFVIAELTSRYGVDTPEAKASVAHGAADVISKMPHGVYREVMLAATAKSIGLAEDRLMSAITQQHPEARVLPAHPTKARPNPQSAGPGPAHPQNLIPQPASVQRTQSDSPRAPASSPARHFTGGALIPGMAGPKSAPAQQYRQFQNRNDQALKTLSASGNVENFTRQAVITELKHSRGALNARYLADNVTQTISELVGESEAKSMASKIRTYTLTATEQYNKRLAEYEKSGNAPTSKPSASPSSGMGMGR